MNSKSSDSSEPASMDLRDLLGYLNLSDGTPSDTFRSRLNDLFSETGIPCRAEQLTKRLQSELDRLCNAGDSAFTNTEQIQQVLELVPGRILRAYQKHHSDLLFHIEASDLLQPLFVAKCFESVLAEASQSGWSDPDKVVTGAVLRLNDFVGHRPVAVLENGRRAEVYEHERFCPVPLFMKGTGAAAGPYRELIDSAVSVLKSLPDDLTHPAHFHIENLLELALDVRSHDHLHPVNKRTNYMFGEWDPETISSGGDYTRFVIRDIILSSLRDWVETGRRGTAREERLHDAGIVLAGTILMASAISGSGPHTYDSGISLTTLLPIVARQRDRFYTTLLEQTDGKRKNRLRRQARQTRHPFGHVRHQLNMHLSSYGAAQLQRRHLSWLYAEMGFDDASRQEAAAIPCLSARFESELHSARVLTRRLLQEGQAREASEQVARCIDLLERGIRCGAIVDPWNILGFQGMFPLFAAREDAIPDNRIELLIEIIEDIFDSSSAVMSAAAAAGEQEALRAARDRFAALAETWDAYGTTAVNDVPHVRGEESLAAADAVSGALAAWHQAGESAGDVSFWREHVQRFTSSRSFSQVIGTLLDRNDLAASLGLLMQWLCDAEGAGMESGRHSIHFHLRRLMGQIFRISDQDERWQNLRRLFAFVEANAGDFWSVPSLREFRNTDQASDTGDSSDGSGLDIDNLFNDEHDDGEDDTFRAAYDEVIYRDSADDGNDGDTVDDSTSVPGNTEFEILYRQLEPRLKFLHTVASLWSSSALHLSEEAYNPETTAAREAEVREWLSSIRRFLKQLAELVSEVEEYEIDSWSQDVDSNIEYDIQMQAKLLLMQNALATTVEFLMAERLLCAVLMDGDGISESRRVFDDQLVRVLRAVLSEDVEEVRELFPDFCTLLKRRPLLYVPFENDGRPQDILKSRTLQAVIRLLLSRLPRLGMLEETWRLMLVAYHMERNLRPLGQAVTEFDRLFRIALHSSVEAVINAVDRHEPEESKAQVAYQHTASLRQVYQKLWSRHSRSMRLSVVEELMDDERAGEIREVIEKYGEELFHTRMLTLGNARAILHHGVEGLIEQLREQTRLGFDSKLADDIDSGVIDEDDIADDISFVYECVVDNFDRFLEYNTTTTYSDYGNQLYCLMDFLALEAMYDRFEWNHVPYQVVHEATERSRIRSLADRIIDDLTEDSRESSQALVDRLNQLERNYGVRLPTLHDRINEQLLGPLRVNRLRAHLRAVYEDCTDRSLSDPSHDAFRIFRTSVTEYMQNRLGSGLEAPEWLQQLGRELEQIQDENAGVAEPVLPAAEETRLTPEETRRQLTRMRKLRLD